MLSSEMTHGMSQDGVPHFMHATLKSVCTGVDANTHEILGSRHVQCCCERAECYREDWLDHFEDGTLIGCLFDLVNDSEVLNVAHAGVATGDRTRNDEPRCYSETRVSTNTANSDHLQNYHSCEHSTCK